MNEHEKLIINVPMRRVLFVSTTFLCPTQRPRSSKNPDAGVVLVMSG